MTATITHVEVIPVAGHDSMLLNLSGAHAPFFTRNLAIVTDSEGREGLGEVPGSEAIRETSKEWASLWQTLQIEVDSLDEYGDKMVVTGAWRMRGAASGIDGEMPIFIVFTFRDGKIAVLEWFADRDTAVAAARGD